MEKIRIREEDLGVAREVAKSFSHIGSSPERVAELMAETFPLVEKPESEKIAAVVASAVGISEEMGCPIWSFLGDFECSLWEVSPTKVWFSVDDKEVLAFIYEEESTTGPDREYVYVLG